MSSRQTLLGTRTGVAIVVVLVVASSIGGILFVGQLASTPYIKIAPSVALQGNPVVIEVVPPGPVIKGSFFTLLSVNYYPDSDPSAQQQLQNASGLTFQHVFGKPGKYTIIAGYKNGGSQGTVKGELTVLPSTFTVGPLRYGSSASYHGSNGTLSLSNPFGIYNMPVDSSGLATNLSIINVAMSLTTSMNVSVSGGTFTVQDSFSQPRKVYSINSSALVTGQGYVNALIGGIGLNLSATLSLETTSTTFNTIADNSTVSQKSNLTADLSVGYTSSALHVIPASTSTIDSFTQAYAPDKLLFSSLGNNGTFSMPAEQINLYRNSLPSGLAMNLSGTANGYAWKTGVFEPSLSDSRLAINFGPLLYNSTYALTLDSLSALPAAYSFSQVSSINGTLTHLSVLLSRYSVVEGGKVVNDTGGHSLPTERGSYMTWLSGALPQVNDSTLLPFPIRDAYDYAINQTNLTLFLARNPGAFLSYASYNYSRSEWSMTFASVNGSAYSLSITRNGTAETSSPSVSGAPSDLSSPFGSRILTVASAGDIAAGSPYSNYFMNKSGNLSLSTLTFLLRLPYQPAVSPFLPSPVQYADFAYVLTSTAGAVLAIDATNGQLIYLVTGFAQALPI